MNMNAAMDLLAYLDTCPNHADRHEFWTAVGQPDMDAARAFAEQMRSLLGSLLDEFVTVEQRHNMVELATIDSTETIGA